MNNICPMWKLSLSWCIYIRRRRIIIICSGLFTVRITRISSSSSSSSSSSVWSSYHQHHQQQQLCTLSVYGTRQPPQLRRCLLHHCLCTMRSWVTCFTVWQNLQINATFTTLHILWMSVLCTVCVTELRHGRNEQLVPTEKFTMSDLASIT